MRDDYRVNWPEGEVFILGDNCYHTKDSPKFGKKRDRKRPGADLIFQHPKKITSTAKNTNLSGYCDLDIGTALYGIDGTDNVADSFLDAWPTGCRKHDDCDPSAGQVLLVPQISVRRDKYFISRFLRLGQQHPILQGVPSLFIRRGNLVCGQVTAQWYQRALVEKHLHSGCVQGL